MSSRTSPLSFRTLLLAGVLTIIAVAVAVPSFLAVRAQQGAIDLNGRWKTSDGQEVVIAQSGQTVKATFVSGGDCPSGGTRDFYLQGSLSGNSLSGTMKRCTRNQQLLQDCQLTDPYSAKIIDATVDQNTITGKYVPDYITYDEKNGHYVNCQVHPGEGGETAFSLTRSGPAAASKPTTEARGEVKTTAAETKAPPIITIAIASAIDEKGKLVNPRFTFPPNEPQITAIIYVGKSNGGQLKVTWYKVSEDEDGKPFDEKLFEHQIQVKSNERAFSVAKNPGGALELGRYKVAATLEGQTKETAFDVSAPKRPSKTSNRPEEELFEDLVSEPGAVATGSDRVFSLGTNSGGWRAASAYEWAHGSEPQMQKIMWNASSLTTPSNTIAPPQAQQGKRPVAGTSGTTPESESSPTGASTSDCKVEVYGPEGDIDTDAPTVTVTARAECTKVPHSYEVDVEGERKGGFDSGSYVYFEVNPCDDRVVGSDLPGTRIRVQVRSSYYASDSAPLASAVITLGKDTSAPRVEVYPNPPRGSLVKEGDKIYIPVIATEWGLGWETGLKRIWLKATPEGSFDKKEWPNPSPLPKPCKDKTRRQPFEATYTVPKKPPLIIDICSYAADYADNEGSNCA